MTKSRSKTWRSMSSTCDRRRTSSNWWDSRWESTTRTTTLSPTSLLAGRSNIKETLPSRKSTTSLSTSSFKEGWRRKSQFCVWCTSKGSWPSLVSWWTFQTGNDWLSFPSSSPQKYGTTTLSKTFTSPKYFKTCHLRKLLHSRKFSCSW